jgi:hypothetical protein
MNTDLSERERAALKHCCTGYIEKEESFPSGVGPATFEALLENGYIECVMADDFTGYRITEKGKRAYFDD